MYVTHIGELPTHQVVDNSEGSLTENQRQIIDGCLLGDATMRCKLNSLIEVNHSFKQKELVDHLYFILSKFVSTPPKPRKSNGRRIAYRFTTRSLPIFNSFYRRFFPLGKKRVPTDIKLTPISLAYWIMDDGSRTYRAMYLNTQQFNVIGQRILLDRLHNIGIEASLNKDKIYHRIRICTASTVILKEMVFRYILPGFRYKFS
jgi:hypothetical protein